MKELNIYQRINAVMKNVQYVQKDTSVGMGGSSSYKAVSHDQVIAVVRSSMVESGIVVRVEQTSGVMLQLKDKAAGVGMHLYSGEYDVYFVNIDNPSDFMVAKINAHANDSGDKSPGKALSYAVKYAILKTFSLETGENDESRVAEDDISGVSKQIADAKTMDELLAAFKLAWHQFPKSREALTSVKDARKRELSE